jgi:hypothetical protein
MDVYKILKDDINDNEIKNIKFITMPVANKAGRETLRNIIN